MPVWINEMAAFMKELDPNHLVTSGGEGFWGAGNPRADNNPQMPASRSEMPAQPAFTHMFVMPACALKALGASSFDMSRTSAHRWATQTGQDFTNNTNAKGVDFGGIHVWPDNWEMCATLSPLQAIIVCHASWRTAVAVQSLS
jgi:mannan endo-1,4-beta-mannosidase